MVNGEDSCFQPLSALRNEEVESIRLSCLTIIQTSLSSWCLCVNPTFAIRTKKRLFLGVNRQEALDYKGVNF